MLVKTSGIKLGRREKVYGVLTFLLICSPSCRHDHTFSSSLTWRSLNQCIPIVYMSFLSVVDNAFVNSLLNCVWSYLLNINFITLLELMVQKELKSYMFSFITLNVSYAMLATLFLCNMFKLSLIEDNLRDSQIFWIINLNYTHFQLA